VVSKDFQALVGDGDRGEFGVFGLSLVVQQKKPPPNVGGGFSRDCSGNLLANDAWIILRQIEASLMLLL
jgi:hypothetical protein